MPTCQGLAQLVSIILGAFILLNYILQESRHFHDPEKLGAKQPLAISLAPISVDASA